MQQQQQHQIVFKPQLVINIFPIKKSMFLIALHAGVYASVMSACASVCKCV